MLQKINLCTLSICILALVLQLFNILSFGLFLFVISDHVKGPTVHQSSKTGPSKIITYGLLGYYLARIIGKTRKKQEMPQNKAKIICIGLISVSHCKFKSHWVFRSYSLPCYAWLLVLLS